MDAIPHFWRTNGYRHALFARHMTVRMARTGIASSQHLGRYRCVVDRRFAWLGQDRRLTIRDERRPDIHPAFVPLGCAPICFKTLDRLG